jgi:hypothetical protein
LFRRKKNPYHRWLRRLSLSFGHDEVLPERRGPELENVCLGCQVVENCTKRLGKVDF